MVPKLIKRLVVGDREIRRRVERSIPKIQLEAKHIQHCQLVLDRAALLTRLPVGAVVAEIGVDRGQFTRQILEITQPSVLHLVDSWHLDEYQKGQREELVETFASEIEKGRIRIHQKLSLDAADDFEDATFDWIYLDTDHSFENTRAELRAFAPKMKPGGIVAGHDYEMGNWVTGYRYGVVEAVHEFCVERDWELVFITAETSENRSFAIRKAQAGETPPFG